MQAESEKFVSSLAPGVGLHVIRWGSRAKSPVILLHGGGANAHWWDHLAPQWASDNHLIALDFRGHGESDAPAELVTGAFNIDLEALCDHLATPQVTLVGHSMGAHVALDHAARFDRVRGLLLIDPARGAAKKSRRMARLALALRRDYASREEAIERFRFVPSADHCEEALRHSIASHSVRIESNGRFGFKFDPRWFSIPSRPPADLQAIRCPTLIVRGAESTILTAEGAEEMRAEIPRAQVTTVPGAGHHVLLDQPEALATLTQKWLHQLP